MAKTKRVQKTTYKWHSRPKDQETGQDSMDSPE